jgi:hypothetical protein
MTAMSKVVDLRTRPDYQPDFAALARRRLFAARHALGQTAAEFAAMLTPLVGWPVTARAVEAWETRTVPPGDVFIALGTLTPAGPDQFGDERFIGGVLGRIPQSFAPEELCGHWVTCFRFGPEPARKSHVDVAQISMGPDRLMRITNHSPAPRSEGRAAPFRNDIEAQLANRHVVGHWKNSNDTRYFGTFQLAALPGETVMDGVYTGFGSDIEVSSGPWKWVRVDTDSLAGVDLSAVRLRDPTCLGERIRTHSQYAAPFTLADITEGP